MRPAPVLFGPRPSPHFIHPSLCLPSDPVCSCAPVALPSRPARCCWPAAVRSVQAGAFSLSDQSPSAIATSFAGAASSAAPPLPSPPCPPSSRASRCSSPAASTRKRSGSRTRSSRGIPASPLPYAVRGDLARQRGKLEEAARAVLPRDPDGPPESHVPQAIRGGLGASPGPDRRARRDPPRRRRSAWPGHDRAGPGDRALRRLLLLSAERAGALPGGWTLGCSRCCSWAAPPSARAWRRAACSIGSTRSRPGVSAPRSPSGWSRSRASGGGGALRGARPAPTRLQRHDHAAPRRGRGHRGPLRPRGGAGDPPTCRLRASCSGAGTSRTWARSAAGRWRTRSAVSPPPREGHRRPFLRLHVTILFDEGQHRRRGRKGRFGRGGTPSNSAGSSGRSRSWTTTRTWPPARRSTCGTGPSLTANQRFTSSKGYEIVEGSDCVVITAGLRRKPDETRLELVSRNVSPLQGHPRQRQGRRPRGRRDDPRGLEPRRHPHPPLPPRPGSFPRSGCSGLARCWTPAASARCSRKPSM